MRIHALSLLALAVTGPALASQQSDHWASVAAKSKDGVIKLDSQSYDEILDPERDYSVVIQLTALPAQFRCQPCQEFDPRYRQVAASWKRVPAGTRSQHFFASLDFSDGQAIYQRTAPTIQFFPALEGPTKAASSGSVNYDLNRNGLGVENFRSWISDRTPIQFKLYVPFNPVPFVLVPLTLAACAFALYQLWPFVLPILQSRIVWGLASIILILTFTSGYMWNKIKGTPYVQVGQNGQVNWLAAGYSNQLGLETQVVAAMYGVLAFSVIALTLFVPAQDDKIKQRIGVYLWLAMLVIVFSLLMKLFKFKNGGYPYQLLF